MASLATARVPSQTAEALAAEVAALGAVSVQELSREDWCGLAAWAQLREMERRRVLAQLS